MPKVRAMTPLASQLADMWGYSLDLRVALEFCDEIARQAEDVETAVDSDPRRGRRGAGRKVVHLAPL
jgi:hypothetical protein